MTLNVDAIWAELWKRGVLIQCIVMGELAGGCFTELACL